MTKDSYSWKPPKEGAQNKSIPVSSSTHSQKSLVTQHNPPYIRKFQIGLSLPDLPLRLMTLGQRHHEYARPWHIGEAKSFRLLLEVWPRLGFRYSLTTFSPTMSIKTNKRHEVLALRACCKVSGSHRTNTVLMGHMPYATIFGM